MSYHVTIVTLSGVKIGLESVQVSVALKQVVLKMAIISSERYPTESTFDFVDSWCKWSIAIDSGYWATEEGVVTPDVSCDLRSEVVGLDVSVLSEQISCDHNGVEVTCSDLFGRVSQVRSVRWLAVMVRRVFFRAVNYMVILEEPM